MSLVAQCDKGNVEVKRISLKVQGYWGEALNGYGSILHAGILYIMLCAVQFRLYCSHFGKIYIFLACCAIHDLFLNFVLKKIIVSMLASKIIMFYEQMVIAIFAPFLYGLISAVVDASLC